MRKREIRTITVDIFDTILIRKIHPEERQFFLVARQWQKLLQKTFSPELDAEKILNFRIYARKKLFTANRCFGEVPKLGFKHSFDVTLSSWFSELVHSLENHYNITLTNEARNKLVQEMIKIELDVEKKQLQPNRALIELLKTLKRRYQLKIYFVSDMYLDSDQISLLLQFF